MMLSPIKFSLLALIALGSVCAQNNTNDTFATGLLSALRQNNLTQLADIVGNNSAALLPALQNGNKTVLAPSDSALSAVAAQISQGANVDLVSVIAYHVLSGTVRQSSIPRPGYQHEIVPTALNSTNFARRPQVVVLAANGTEGNANKSVILANQNVSFASTTDGPVYQNILVQPITEVLTPPGNLSTVAGELQFNTIAQLLQSTNLLTPLENATAVTIFAPSEAALQNASAQLQAASPADQTTVLGNHVVNGTVVYSTQLPSSNTSANASPITNATSASGEQLSFRNENGTIFVQSGNVSARIIRSDVLINNGVVHVIDGVLLNTASNPTAANNAASSASAAAETNTAAPGGTSGGSGGGNGSGDGAQALVISFLAVLMTMIGSSIVLLA